MQRFKIHLLIAMSSLFAVGYSVPDAGDIVYPVNMSVQGHRLFVSDRYAGVHVYDVADPAHPSHMYTIPLEGNTGNAAVGDVLFANDFTALKAYHLGDESFVEVASFEREPRAIPWMDAPPRDRSSGFGCECEESGFAPDGAPAPSSGSSYATFTVVGDFLYYLDYDALVALDVADPLKPKEVGRSPIDWDVETLYPSEHFLFMGGSRGMYIYQRTNPAAPREIGRLVHTRACDPVVVEGHTAYVTLRGQGQCGGATDELLSIDIADPGAPKLVCETAVVTPHGLAVDGARARLYVSKGDNGFALFDVSAPENPTPVANWSDVTKDFIWSGDLLYSMTFDEVYIYDVTNPAAPVRISTLP